MTGEIRWDKPALLGNEPYHMMAEDDAARKIQGIYKARRARIRLRAMMREVYCVEFDDETGYYFYMDTRTGETSWEKPVMLGTEDLDPNFHVESRGEILYAEQQKRTKVPVLWGPRCSDASRIIFGLEDVQLVRFNVCEADGPQRFKISTEEADNIEWRRVHSFFALVIQENQRRE